MSSDKKFGVLVGVVINFIHDKKFSGGPRSQNQVGQKSAFDLSTITDKNPVESDHPPEVWVS